MNKDIAQRYGGLKPMRDRGKGGLSFQQFSAPGSGEAVKCVNFFWYSLDITNNNAMLLEGGNVMTGASKQGGGAENSVGTT